MANYYGTTRSNYFRVKNPHEFKEYIESKVCCDEDGLDVFENIDKDGVLRFGFGVYGSILGERIDTDDDDGFVDYDYDAFCNALSKFVADDDAIIIEEVGNEKLRYVTGYATVITKDGVDSVDLGDVACKLAAKMLKNEQWKTQLSY